MNKSDLSRNLYMLKGSLANQGYDWWWHNFTGYNQETGEEKAFFIEYFICNPSLGNDKPLLGQLPENKRNNIFPSYALIKVGTWGKDSKQIHNFYPISAFSCPIDKLDVKIGECTLSETHMKGHCTITADEVFSHPEYMCDAGNMSWELKTDKKIAFNVGYGASKFFRTLNAFEMFWHAEGIKTEYSGTVLLDGIAYDITPEKSYGYADKNWGKDFTSPWLWISSCNMKSVITGKVLKNSAIEIGGGRPTVFGVSLDGKLIVGFYYEGKMYEYNFSKFWNPSKVKFSFIEGEIYNEWKVKAINQDTLLVLTLKCKKDEMLFINYESPSGNKYHNRLWNGGNGFGEIKFYKNKGKEKILIDHIKLKNAGCEYGEY